MLTDAEKRRAYFGVVACIVIGGIIVWLLGKYGIIAVTWLSDNQLIWPMMAGITVGLMARKLQEMYTQLRITTLLVHDLKDEIAHLRELVKGTRPH